MLASHGIGKCLLRVVDVMSSRSRKLVLVLGHQLRGMTKGIASSQSFIQIGETIMLIVIGWRGDGHAGLEAGVSSDDAGGLEGKMSSHHCFGQIVGGLGTAECYERYGGALVIAKRLALGNWWVAFDLD